MLANYIRYLHSRICSHPLLSHVFLNHSLHLLVANFIAVCFNKTPGLALLSKLIRVVGLSAKMDRNLSTHKGCHCRPAFQSTCTLLFQRLPDALVNIFLVANHLENVGGMPHLHINLLKGFNQSIVDRYGWPGCCCSQLGCCYQRGILFCR